MQTTLTVVCHNCGAPAPVHVVGNYHVAVCDECDARRLLKPEEVQVTDSSLQESSGEPRNGD